MNYFRAKLGPVHTSIPNTQCRTCHKAALSDMMNPAHIIEGCSFVPGSWQAQKSRPQTKDYEMQIPIVSRPSGHISQAVTWVRRLAEASEGPHEAWVLIPRSPCSMHLLRLKGLPFQSPSLPDSVHPLPLRGRWGLCGQRKAVGCLHPPPG